MNCPFCTKEAQWVENKAVQKVIYPFEAENREEAIKIITEKLKGGEF